MNKALSDDNFVAIVGAIVAENGNRFNEPLFTGLTPLKTVTDDHSYIF